MNPITSVVSGFMSSLTGVNLDKPPGEILGEKLGQVVKDRLPGLLQGEAAPNTTIEESALPSSAYVRVSATKAFTANESSESTDAQNGTIGSQLALLKKELSHEIKIAPIPTVATPPSTEAENTAQNSHPLRMQIARRKDTILTITKEKETTYLRDVEEVSRNAIDLIGYAEKIIREIYITIKTDNEEITSDVLREKINFVKDKYNNYLDPNRALALSHHTTEPEDAVAAISFCVEALLQQLEEGDSFVKLFNIASIVSSLKKLLKSETFSSIELDAILSKLDELKKELDKGSCAFAELKVHLQQQATKVVNYVLDVKIGAVKNCLEQGISSAELSIEHAKGVEALARPTTESDLLFQENPQVETQRKITELNNQLMSLSTAIKSAEANRKKWSEIRSSAQTAFVTLAVGQAAVMAFGAFYRPNR